MFKNSSLAFISLLESPSVVEFCGSLLLHSGIARSGEFSLSCVFLLDIENVDG